MRWMDYHLHTQDSADSSATMEAMCRRAVAIGLSEVCFTEHYDVDPYDKGYTHYDDARYEGRLAAAREKFAGRLVIRKGLEFDFQSRHAGRLAERLSRWKFDFVLGSVHNVFNTVVFEAIGRRGFPPDEVYREYFHEVELLIATGLPDCLGHLDYVAKTSSDLLAGYRYGDYEARMKALAARLVAAGIGLEVNSRYYGRQPLAPGLEALRTYHQAGGLAVTLGSDAHSPEGLGVAIPESCRLLREAGFTEYLSFEARRPRSWPLPEEVPAALAEAQPDFS